MAILRPNAGCLIRCANHLFRPHLHLLSTLPDITFGPPVIAALRWHPDTKRPSITSRSIRSAPAKAPSRASWPSFEKSDDSIDGAMIAGLVTGSSPSD
jgi:hypothetical protein